MSLCVGILIVVTIVNTARTTRSRLSPSWFRPYLFLGTLFIVIAAGLIRVLSEAVDTPRRLRRCPSAARERSGHLLVACSKFFAKRLHPLTGWKAVSTA